jgi:hypothetical protein
MMDYQEVTMSVKPIKLNTVVDLLLALCIGLYIGLFLGLFGGIGIGKIKTAEKPENSSGPVLPIRNVYITIDPSQRDELLAQIQKFASKWKYTILIDPNSLNPEKFEVYLWRSDMRAVGDYPIGPGRLAVSFHYTNPAVPVPERFFDEEIADLEIFISEIPGATLTVEKP